jgi:hypothetical protein
MKEIMKISEEIKFVGECQAIELSDDETSAVGGAGRWVTTWECSGDDPVYCATDKQWTN